MKKGRAVTHIRLGKNALGKRRWQRIQDETKRRMKADEAGNMAFRRRVGWLRATNEAAK